jgi:hypothetical protein
MPGRCLQCVAEFWLLAVYSVVEDNANQSAMQLSHLTAGQRCPQGLDPATVVKGRAFYKCSKQLARIKGVAQGRTVALPCRKLGARQTLANEHVHRPAATSQHARFGMTTPGGKADLLVAATLQKRRNDVSIMLLCMLAQTA